MSNLRWGIIGLGRIAREFVAQFPAGQTLYGCAASAPERAVAFAKDLAVPHVYDSYQTLCADPAIDVVYIATTHDFHAGNIRLALEAGKHVLCEKPITLNGRQLAALTALAAKKRLVLMEAQTIYHMPLYQAIAGFAKDHAVGPLRLVQASLGEQVPVNLEDRFYNPQRAGGGLLDMGIYPLSLARRFMTARPELVATAATKAVTGVDLTSTLVLTNAQGEQAVLVTSLAARLPNRAYLTFASGSFEIINFGRAAQATWLPNAGEPVTVSAGATSLAMGYEAQAMAQAVATGANPTAVWTADTMAVMDAARGEWGLRYPGED
ncbi:Gfo/Idh/MocA family protein [Lacticaseibacillus suihuaensis]